jgi:hypothetical protein
MPSLTQLAALADRQDALDTLAQRVLVQQAALTDALDDFNTAKTRFGALVDTPTLQDQPEGARLNDDQIRATAEFILRADRRRRGEETVPAPAIARAVRTAPSTPQGAAQTAAFILAAHRRARGEAE